MIISIASAANACPPSPAVANLIPAAAFTAADHSSLHHEGPYTVSIDHPVLVNNPFNEPYYIPGNAYHPARGAQPVLGVIVYFADNTTNSNLNVTMSAPSDEWYGSSYDTSYFSNLLFNTNMPSARLYFKENSYNKFDLFGRVVSVTLSNTLKYYAEDIDPQWRAFDPDNATKYAVLTEAFERAAVQLSAIGDSMAHYMAGGYVHNFIIFCMTSNQAVSSAIAAWGGNTTKATNADKYIYPQRYDWHIAAPGDITEAGGGKLGWGIVATADTPIGTVCHELAHNLGAPDFSCGEPYMTFKTVDPIGEWELMAEGLWNYGTNAGGVKKKGYGPADLGSWNRWHFGWIDTPTIIRASGTYSINELAHSDTGSMYFIPLPQTDDNEWLLLENRAVDTTRMFHVFTDNSANQHFDAGLLIWHGDSSSGFLSQDEIYPNRNTAHNAFEIMNVVKNCTVAEDMHAAPIAAGHTYNRLDIFTISGFRDFAGRPIHLFITNVSVPGSVMTFDVRYANLMPNTARFGEGDEDPGIIISPNPVTGNEAYVRFNLSRSAEVKMAVYDSYGHMITETEWQFEYVGENRQRLLLPDDIANGMYYVECYGRETVDDASVHPFTLMGTMVIMR